jgi:signal transduction histidine kinase
MVRDYWPVQYRRAIWTTIGASSCVAMTVGIFLLIADWHILSPVFWLIVIGTGISTGGIMWMVVRALIMPLRDIAYALTHVSGEPNAVEPPSLNTQAIQRSGHRPLLDLIYTLGANYDTEQRTTRDTASSDLLASALQHATASLVILNDDGIVLYASPSAPLMTDREGVSSLKLLFDNNNTIYSWLKNSRKHSVHAHKEWLRVPSDPIGVENRRIFDISASYEKGSVAPATIMLFDRTAVYQPDDDQLDFISFAAHELRGPVTVIKGYLDVLQDELAPTLSTEHQSLLERLIVSSNRLSGYIANILNASRYDQRHMHITLRELQLADVYELIRDDMDLRAKTQNRAISIAIPATLPTIAADISTLTEVFSNLIDNAIKYSHEGGTVTVQATAGESIVQVDVIDQGIGMPASVVSNLFHKFYRSHRSRETVAGSGIGLYISKAIIESCGGTIEVRSQEGIGTTISFTLPVYAAIAPQLEVDGTISSLIHTNKTSWIQNHTKIRG